MEKKKLADQKKAVENKHVQQLLIRCREMLNKSDYNFDQTMDNKQFRTFLLKSVDSKISLLEWALRKRGIQVASCSEQSLYESLHSLGILTSKENDFVKGSMNALSQLRKWELIFQCVLVHQDNTICDNNCNLGDNNTGADCEYELKDIKSKIQLLPDNLYKKFQRSSVKDRVEITKNDIQQIKDELEKTNNQDVMNCDELMNNANNAEEYLSTYFHLGNDLDCGFQHYLSINAKQPSSNTDTCCLDANILPNIIEETDLILNGIQTCKDTQAAFNGDVTEMR